MTVMPSSSDVADKAVSTEDASSGVEVARLEAVLAALVETKVEAMKASSGTAARRVGSAPSSPRRLRLTSSSTVSSSQQHHHHGHHHHHHHDFRDKKGADKRGRHDHRHRRHGSAPCGDYIEDPVTHHHKQRHGKGKQKLLDSPRSAEKRRRSSKMPQALSRGEIHPVVALELLHQDVAPGTTDQELSLINFDRATREAMIDDARLHQSACYLSHSTAHIKNHFEDEDYLAFNYADDLEEETFSGPAVLSSHHHHPDLESRERYHKPRRKRKRRRRRTIVDVEEVVEVVGPDDLPPQARWTIMATAIILLFMSLALVGVTLRMAPIIDEMVRKENEELLNSLNRDSSVPENVTSLPP